MNNFDRAMQFILKWEGGFVDHPSDPGGRTKYGLSQRAYPMLDIINLTLDDADMIYKKDYWMAAGCDKLTWPMSLVVFDTAVNMGVGRAKSFQPKAFNWTDYLFIRIEYYAKLNRPEFIKGWINRVVDLYRTCKKDEHPISEKL